MKSNRKSKRLISIAVVLVLLIAFISGFTWRMNTQTSQPSIKNITELQAYESHWKTLNGSPILVADILGKRTLINFWGSWCPPCVAEMPLLSEFHSNFADQNFQVIGFAVDIEQNAQKFLEDNSIAFPSLIADATTVTEIIGLKGNEQGVLPYSVFFDEKGNLEKTFLGEIKRKQLQSLVQ